MFESHIQQTFRRRNAGAENVVSNSPYVDLRVGLGVLLDEDRFEVAGGP